MIILPYYSWILSLVTKTSSMIYWRKVYSCPYTGSCVTHLQDKDFLPVHLGSPVAEILPGSFREADREVVYCFV